MIISFFSDTHRKHGQGSIGDYSAFQGSDIVVFSGDMSMRGTTDEIADFVHWYSLMPVKHKILISGNHDFFWEKADDIAIKSMLDGKGLTYLNDSGVTIEGITFWGSPIQPWFHNWAFNRLPGNDIAKHWDLIPSGVDVLITHGPPYGALDQVVNQFSNDNNRRVGCPTLRRQIDERIKPKVHAFGHIHEGAGTLEEGGVIYINGSVLDENYNAVHLPTKVEVTQELTFKLMTDGKD